VVNCSRLIYEKGKGVKVGHQVDLIYTIPEWLHEAGYAPLVDAGTHLRLWPWLRPIDPRKAELHRRDSFNADWVPNFVHQGMGIYRMEALVVAHIGVGPVIDFGTRGTLANFQYPETGAVVTGRFRIFVDAVLHGTIVFVPEEAQNDALEWTVVGGADVWVDRAYKHPEPLKRGDTLFLAVAWDSWRDLCGNVI
jgi:hypothetical protein